MSMQPLSFAEFAAKPFIQKAIQNPKTPESVLSFFFGVDYEDPESIDIGLRQGQCFAAMSDLWWKGFPEYDTLCQTTFTEAIRAAGSGSFLKEEKVVSTTPTTTRIDNYMSEIILCDQLSRNCFRGSLEAFEYDPIALKRARQVAELFLSQNSRDDDEGEIYPPYVVFLNTAFMHSESLQDHETISKIMDQIEVSAPQLQQMWTMQRQFAKDHQQVIERFGRYPHRNQAKGRTNTAEEEIWLNDVENLPGWAKSQMTIVSKE